MPAKPLRMALGSLIIQKQYDYADRELVEQLTENPYYQFFIGLPGYQQEPPFAPSLLVEFRKCLTDDILGEINEMIIEFNHPNEHTPAGGCGNPKGTTAAGDGRPDNKGTLILDVSCAPGKAASPVEFGVKLDLSIDDNGMARIEKQSFDAYNESDVLIGAVERYHKRTGHYPKRVLADKIYRNRNNFRYCKEHGIRLSGPALGRPKKESSEDKNLIYTDAVDRIEIERGFSLAKRCYGLGLLRTKLDTTTRSSICLSIIAMNVARLSVAILCNL